MIGGFQIACFQPAYQQGAFIPPGTVMMPNVVGEEWYQASDDLFEAGFLQNQPPKTVMNLGVRPRTVLAQYPQAGAFVPPKTNVYLTISIDSLLVANFDLIIHKVPP